MHKQNIQPDRPIEVSPPLAHKPDGIEQSPAVVRYDKYHVETNPHFIRSNSPDAPTSHKSPGNRRAGALVQRPQPDDGLPEDPKQQSQRGDTASPRTHHRSQASPLQVASKTETAVSVLCLVFWVAVLLLGLAALVLYAVFYPPSPRFGVSAASLSSFRLDKDNTLYANLSLTVSFTNPNKNPGVGLKFVVVELYFGRTLLDSQSIEPFSVPKARTAARQLHMAAARVRLHKLEIARLEKRAINESMVAVEVRSSFLAHSHLLKNSFWSHGLCTVRLKKPPHGDLVSSNCITKQ